VIVLVEKNRKLTKEEQEVWDQKLDLILKKLKFDQENFKKADKEYADSLKCLAEFLGVDLTALTLGLIDITKEVVKFKQKG